MDPIDRSWWLGEGPEQCPVCLQGYALEVEIRCWDCDGPLCPHCVVRIRGGRWQVCPECASGAEASASGASAPGEA